jgi:hypothetical protein
MEAERNEHRGRRDSETLRDAEEIRADSNRMKHATRFLEHARKALEASRKSGGREGRKRKGFRESVRA